MIKVKYHNVIPENFKSTPLFFLFTKEHSVIFNYPKNFQYPSSIHLIYGKLFIRYFNLKKNLYILGDNSNIMNTLRPQTVQALFYNHNLSTIIIISLRIIFTSIQVQNINTAIAHLFALKLNSLHLTNAPTQKKRKPCCGR
jgi:hypothetical protein